MELKNEAMLIKALLKLHRLILWNSRIKQCSPKLCLNCINLYCGTQELNDDHQSFAKLDKLLMWNSRMKQWSSKLCLNCIDFYCGTQEENNAHQKYAKLQRLLLLCNSRIKQCSSKHS